RVNAYRALKTFSLAVYILANGRRGPAGDERSGFMRNREEDSPRSRSKSLPIVLAVVVTVFRSHSISAQLIDEFPIPSGGAPRAIACGPGGMCFADFGARTGLVDPNGTITEFPIPRQAHRLVGGPDGNVWFTSNGFLSRMTPAGNLTEYAIADNGPY